MMHQGGLGCRVKLLKPWSSSGELSTDKAIKTGTNQEKKQSKTPNITVPSSYDHLQVMRCTSPDGSWEWMSVYLHFVFLCHKLLE